MSRAPKVYGPTGMLAEVTGSAVNFLTPDHLGSPRVLTSQNGVVVNRRDFFPFGEDIAVGVGGRSAGMGYGTDSLRQRFTGYEKDEETGLDFAQARYYANSLGRFQSVDPLLSSGQPPDPQTWNRYAYAVNNPLIYTDPTGMFTYAKGVTQDQKDKFEAALKQAYDDLETIKQTYGANSQEYQAAKSALDAYSAANTNNGVVVDFTFGGSGGQTTINPATKVIRVNFNPGELPSVTPDSTGTLTAAKSLLPTLIAHEGSHVADYQDYKQNKKKINDYQAEYKAFSIQVLFGEVVAKRNKAKYYEVRTPGNKNNPSQIVTLWNSGWAQADVARLSSDAINDYLAVPTAKGGKYGLTPTSTAKTYFRGLK